MKLKIKIIFFTLLSLFIFPVLVSAQGSTPQCQAYDQCLLFPEGGCDAEQQACEASKSASPGQSQTNPRVLDPVQPSSAGSGSCTPDASNKFCPGPNFCTINGVCVPAPTDNPGGLRGATTVFGLVQLVMTWMLTFAGIIATIFLIIGGYQYITAGGNEEASEKGKKTILSAIIGIVVVVLAITIVTIITNTLGQSNPLG